MAETQYLRTVSNVFHLDENGNQIDHWNGEAMSIKPVLKPYFVRWHGDGEGGVAVVVAGTSEQAIELAKETNIFGSFCSSTVAAEISLNAPCVIYTNEGMGKEIPG